MTDITKQYGTMDRAAIWAEARDVLVAHFTEQGYDVHHNDVEQTVTVIDREPGNPQPRSGSRCVTIKRGTGVAE
jgi:hypothetical protein